MYSSLLARGAILVKNCDNEFAKIVVAGLVILISGQALMHMMINVDLGPLTGQTLPMISHGNSSFIAFSIAFGIILAISRMAKEKVDRETEQAAPIYDTTPEPKDEIQAKMDVLEELDN
jgi:cell division protein FtsW